MARNRAGQNTYDTIIEAAIALFGEVGFSGASIRAIGARAGVTLGAVHHHFDGKEHLYNTCVEVADKRLREQLFSEVMGLDRDGDMSNVTRQIIHIGIRFVRDNLQLIRFLQRSYVQEHQRVTRERARRQEGAFSLLIKTLSQRNGRDEASLWVACKAIQFALVRFAASGDEELLRITGKDTVEAALAAVEETLHRMAVDALF